MEAGTGAGAGAGAAVAGGLDNRFPPASVALDPTTRAWASERVAALAKCREMRDDARKGLHVDGALSFVVREVLHERRVDLGLGRAVAEYSGDEGARTVADVRTHRGLGKGRQTA